MNNTEPKQKSLLELYKLLWEQIKGQNKLLFGLCAELRFMAYKGIISEVEHFIIDDDIWEQIEKQGKESYLFPLTEQGTSDRKSFVQQQIEKLKNKD